MTERMKPAIKKMYRDIKLSEDDLDCFHSMAKEHEFSNSLKNKLRRILLFPEKFIYASTTVGMLFLVGFIWFMSPDATVNIDSKSEKIFEDVVNNHLSDIALKYTSASLVELSSNFSYLGFMLSKSQAMMDVGGDLKGARPCFILNMPAVQLRYQAAGHKLWKTVYQTRYEKSIHGSIPDLGKHQTPLVKIKKGIQVILWRRDGLLFAVAE